MTTISKEQQSNKTTQRDQTNIVFSKEFLLSKILRIDFNDIPYYLSKQNQSFQTKIYSILPETKNLEKFRCIAISMYKIFAIEIFDKLWKIYQQLTMGQLQIPSLPIQITNEIHPKICPKEILSLVKQHYGNQYPKTKEEEENLCLKLIHDCLCLLHEKSEEYRRELRSYACPLSDYTPEMEQTIENFVQQGLIYLRSEIDCQIALFQYYYIDEILKRQYLSQHPNDPQVNVSSVVSSFIFLLFCTNKIKLFERLCKLKHVQETTKNIVHFLKETNTIYLSSYPPFDSHAIVQAPMINSIWKPSLQQELFMHYKMITELARLNQLDIYMKSLEEQMNYYEKQLHSIIDKIWKLNKSLPSHQQLTPTMLKLIDQRFNNMTAYIECIYKFKRHLIHLRLKNTHL